jgi:hypothetical protein
MRCFEIGDPIVMAVDFDTQLVFLPILQRLDGNNASASVPFYAQSQH